MLAALLQCLLHRQPAAARAVAWMCSSIAYVAVDCSRLDQKTCCMHSRAAGFKTELKLPCECKIITMMLFQSLFLAVLAACCL